MSGGDRHPAIFFENPPIKTDAPLWGIPQLKNEARPSEKQIPPLKHETPLHEMIPRKSTINNNLKSSQNPWQIYVKKFIFIKFGGFQAFSRQFYYQMNSFTGIF